MFSRGIGRLGGSVDELRPLAGLGSNAGNPINVTSDTSNIVHVPAAGSAAGRVLYVQNGALWAQRFDDRSFEPIGEAVQVAADVGLYWASRDTLAYTAEDSQSSQLTWMDPRGNETKVGEPGRYSQIRLSPDGTRAAVTRRGAGGSDLWLIDLVRGGSDLFATGARSPVWSADGEWIAYTVDRKVYRKRFNGGRDGELLFEASSAPAVVGQLTDWSSDGRFLLYWSPLRGGDIFVASLEAGTPESRRLTGLFTSPDSETAAMFSPDMRWIAYVLTREGRPEVYAHPFSTGSAGDAPSVGDRFKVSTAGGSRPRWRADSKELTYRTPAGSMVAVTLTANPRRPFGTEKVLAGRTAATELVGSGPLGLEGGDIASDGQRALVALPVTQPTPSPLTVITNWQTGLR